MSFHVHNLSLALGISGAVRSIGKELFDGPSPKLFHHYTSAVTVEAVVQSRSLWATCIDDQEDKTEVTHASGLVEQLAEEISQVGTTDFATDVLGRLPFYMEERKQSIFIACFCDDHDSALHWEKYGNYCLTFSAHSSCCVWLLVSNVNRSSAKMNGESYALRVSEPTTQHRNQLTII